MLFITLKNQCSNDEAQRLFEREEGQRPDDGEGGEDEDGADDHHGPGGPPVAHVSPEGRRDAVAGAVDHEHGADQERREVELAHVRLQGRLEETKRSRSGGDAGENELKIIIIITDSHL